MTQDWYLHHGDAFAFLRSLPDASVDALITDPPYSSGGAFRNDRVAKTGAKYQRAGSVHRLPDFGGDNRDQRSFLAWMALWLNEARRVLVDGAPVVLFTDWRQLPTMTDALQVGGFTWRGIKPWTKPHPRPAKGRFAACSEFIVWGSKGGMSDEGACLGTKPWVFAPPHFSRKLHQTEKPVDLMREIVRIAPASGTVLDPFVGSGATGEACLLEGRAFIGSEESAEYHARASERLTSLSR